MKPAVQRDSWSSDWACWCGLGRWQMTFRTARFRLLRCSACQSYRIDPVPVTSLRTAAELYTDYSRVSAEPWEEHAGASTRESRFWRVVDRAPQLRLVHASVVDIGCGEGGLCSELHAAGWPRVLGVDISKTRIARARRRHPDLTFSDRPLDEIGLTPASCDLIILDNVKEHFAEPAVALGQLRRFLKPGGRCVLITPNMDSGHFRLLGRRWTPELCPHAHVFLFTAASMRSLLRQLRFDVEAIGSFHSAVYSAREWLDRCLRADVKGAVWRAGQEIGGLYGRIVDQGPYLYAVARLPDLTHDQR
jgi:SAM-dependent methyltransferase